MGPNRPPHALFRLNGNAELGVSPPTSGRGFLCVPVPIWGLFRFRLDPPRREADVLPAAFFFLPANIGENGGDVIVEFRRMFVTHFADFGDNGIFLHGRALPPNAG